MWYMFPVQHEELRINYLTLPLVLTMPYTCSFLCQTEYIADSKWRLHFQFGIEFWRVILREVCFEEPNRIWRALKTSILNTIQHHLLHEDHGEFKTRTLPNEWPTLPSISRSERWDWDRHNLTVHTISCPSNGQYRVVTILALKQLGHMVGVVVHVCHYVDSHLSRLWCA